MPPTSNVHLILLGHTSGTGRIVGSFCFTNEVPLPPCFKQSGLTVQHTKPNKTLKHAEPTVNLEQLWGSLPQVKEMTWFHREDSRMDMKMQQRNNTAEG